MPAQEGHELTSISIPKDVRDDLIQMRGELIAQRKYLRVTYGDVIRLLIECYRNRSTPVPFSTPPEGAATLPLQVGGQAYTPGMP